MQLRLCEWLTNTASLAPSWEGAVVPPRLFAGSSRRSEEDVRSGRLLEELAWRLRALTLEAPPLRERRDDLPRIVERMLTLLNSQSDRQTAGLTASAWEVLRRHAWPGNLIELRQVLADACNRSTTACIDASDLPAALRLPQDPLRPTARPVPLQQTLEDVERRLIRLALHRAHGNRSLAAELLGIYRPRLRRRMLALEMPEAATEGDEPDE